MFQTQKTKQVLVTYIRRLYRRVTIFDGSDFEGGIYLGCVVLNFLRGRENAKS